MTKENAPEQKSQPGPPRPERAGLKTLALFAFPAVLAAIGAYFALTRPAPNAAQRQAAHAAPVPSKENGKAP